MSTWVYRTSPKPAADLRLICFPYAGGSAHLFKGWETYLPAEVEVCAVQLPGRAQRIAEPPISDATELARLLADALRPILDRPFAFFGHSMGALISFELARMLRRQGAKLPIHLFLSAHTAPHLPPEHPPIYHLPDDKFVAALERYKGTPTAALQNRELMELVLPTLRADFSVSERYTYVPEEPLACSITVFGGLQDELISPAGLAGWREHTQGSFSERFFPGDHFFLHSAQSLVLHALAQDLDRLIAMRARRAAVSTMSSVREPPNPLDPGIVDLWQVSLDPPAADVACLDGLLTVDERERAERFKFEHLRRRFVVGRGMLRMLLSRLVRRPPEQLVFSYGPHGKPALVTEPGDAPIEFNVAHCEDVALFAFAVGRRIGVDVERARTFADMSDLANHYFAPEERRSLASVSVGQQEAAFYAGWTRKEAFIKATGEGLARELDSFAVTLAPQDPVRIVHVDGDTNAAQRWRLLAIALAPPFFGAVVAEGVDWTLRINTQSSRPAFAQPQP